MVHLKVNKQDLEEFVGEGFTRVSTLEMQGAVLTQYQDIANKTVLIVDALGEEVFVIQ
jgi:hypothetical protein